MKQRACRIAVNLGNYYTRFVPVVPLEGTLGSHLHLNAVSKKLGNQTGMEHDVDGYRY